MKRFFLVLICAVFLLLPVSAHAAETPSLRLSPSASELEPEQTYLIDLSLKGDSDPNLLAGYLTVEYDDCLTLISIESNPAISNGDLQFTLESSSANAIYVSSGRGIPWDTTFLTLAFTVNEDALPGSANITVAMENLVDTKLQRVPGKLTQSTSLSVTKPTVPRAFLTSLVPSAGTLEPAFSQNRKEYELTVPYEVTSLTFQAQAGENGSARVNRKNLKAAGTPTEFIITVTAADGKTKTTYTVTAHRLEKGQTSAVNPVSSVSSAAEPNLSLAFLTNLVPSAGTLEPPFSRDCTEYELTVPYEVTSLAFDAQPGENGTVRVNRKNLQSAGTPTTFTITVTAADGKTKTVYTVIVHRLEKGKTSQVFSSAAEPPGKNSSGKVTEAGFNKPASSHGASGGSVSAEKSSLTELPVSESTPHQNQYLTKNSNRMPDFLTWILFGLSILIGAGLIVVLLTRKHNPPEK